MTVCIRNILNIILFLVLGFGASAFANDQSGGHELLTHEKIITIFDSVTAGKNSEVIDKGNYVLVKATYDQKFYVFTKSTHPAHPGYIEWSFGVSDDGKTQLHAKGTYGANKTAFVSFEQQMNENMHNYVRDRLAKLNPSNL